MKMAYRKILMWVSFDLDNTGNLAEKTKFWGIQKRLKSSQKVDKLNTYSNMIVWFQFNFKNNEI